MSPRSETCFSLVASRQRGLTLVELMIALVIGSILMIGIIQLFSGMRASYQLNESLSRVQESGRFAVELVSDELRVAGYAGPMGSLDRVCNFGHPGDGTDPEGNCPGGGSGGSGGGGGPGGGGGGGPGGSGNFSSIDVFTNQPVVGYEWTGDRDLGEDLSPEAVGSLGEWSGDIASDIRDPDLADLIEDRAIPGSDIFVVRSLGGGGSLSATQPGGMGSNIDTPGNDFNEEEPIVIWDGSGTIFVGHRTNAAGNDTITFPGHFDGAGCCVPPISVARGQEIWFFVGRGADDQPALFYAQPRGDGGVESDELVSGVEMMRMRFGVDETGNGSVDDYRDATQVETDDQWEQVLAARLAFVVRSHTRLTDLPEVDELAVLGDVLDVVDNREYQRRVYSSTVRLRNRIP